MINQYDSGIRSEGAEGALQGSPWIGICTEARLLPALHQGPRRRGSADELVVTVDTVKKHVSHVLSKLDAANRTEAVARGRELGAIDLIRH